jgi:hypothetical protein
LGDPIEKFERAGHVALIGKKRGIYSVLVKKHERKKPPGRRRLRW